MLKDVINKIESDANDVNDTINTQQAKKQKATLVNNDIAENGGKQKTKGCSKKSKEPSEVKKISGLSMASNAFSILMSTDILALSIDGIKNDNKCSWYHAIAFSSLANLCVNLSYLTFMAIKLSKLKQKNKETQTETLLENDKEIQVEPIIKKEENKHNRNIQNAIAEIDNQMKESTTISL